MGICCTRNETTNEEILNSFNRNEPDFSDSTRGPELSFESKRFDNNKLNTQLKILISNMSQVLLSNVKKITFIELWNIALLYKDNHTSSVYLLYDMRDYHSRKENFLKKMRHINYSYDELRMMPNDKLSNFKRFINGKKVIFIFPDEKIDQSSEIINFISELKSDILNLFLNSTLEQKVLSPYTNKLLFFIEEKDYEYLSYILFAYSHLSNLKKEGFSFIYFIPSAYNNDLLTSIKERKEIYQNFIESFNISSIVYISKKRDNEIREFNDMEENAKSISKIAYICEDLNSIIQHITKQSTNIHIFHKIQKCSIHHDFKLNIILLTVYAFGHQYSIQHLISRLILRLIYFDFPLHPFQIPEIFLCISLCSQNSNLMLQIMIFLIHQINGFLRQLIISVLHVHDIMQRILFKTHLHFFHLKMISIQMPIK